MSSDNNSQKKCGFCGESIPANAGRCPYCGSILEVTFDNDYKFTTGEDSGHDTADNVNNDGNSDERPEYNHNVHAQQDIESTNPQQRPDPYSNINDQNYFQGSPKPRDYSNNGYTTGSNLGNDRKQVYNKPPLSNGMKVFLTSLFILIPGFGQLAGIITAIVFMNAEGDSDRKSFGVAVLILSIIMFVLACLGCFIFAIAANEFNY